MSRRQTSLRRIGVVITAIVFVCAMAFRAAHGSTFSTVEPTSISAGMFYHGATLRISGSIGEDSQVVIRIKGASEHHVFNRRGKIGGIIWGGVEHVTFRNAPSFYAIYSSTSLEVAAAPDERSRLQLGYGPLEAQMDVEGTKADKHLMIGHFVQFKESEGLYRVVPGGVHLADPEGSKRAFDAAIPLSASTPPGDFEVAVFELVKGSLVHEDTAHVTLERVGLPASLFRLAHENGVLFGLLALLVTVATGVIVDFLGRLGRRGADRGPVLDVAADLLGLFMEGLLNVRVKARFPEAMERLHTRYRLFRNLLFLNNELLGLLAELEEESSWSSFRHPRVRMGIRALFDGTEDMVQMLNQLTGNRYFDLKNVIAGVRNDVMGFLVVMSEQDTVGLTLPLSEVNSKTADQAGGKAVNLARLECDLGMHVPKSFVVTAQAFRQFLEAEGLGDKLRTVLAPARLDAPDDFQRRCELAQGLVREASVPPPVQEAIRNAYRDSTIPMGEAVAVRSSAAGEDSELSFAGQFDTFLNVPESEVTEAWKGVVVSRFSPRAVFYRRAAGLAEVDTPMAVLVQRMVHARASGVLFTRRPEHPKETVLLVTAVRGLGPEVSAGIASADEFVVSRGNPRHIVERRISVKPTRLACTEGGGLTHLPEAAEKMEWAAITDDEVLRLATAGLSVERYFRCPQDIEWAIDEDGELFILQARPLRTNKEKMVAGDAPRGALLLLHGGEPVWPGRAVGPVHVVKSSQDEERLPTGAILVVTQLLPDCVQLLPRVCGIVAEHGTVTGHAASILREFRVPSLFGVAGAVDRLVNGQIVSLDVASRSVFQGALWPGLRGRLPVRLLGRGTTGLPEVLAGKLTKLSGMNFMGTWACQSLHDVIRFAHEMAIQSMFDIGDRLLDSPTGGVKRLQSGAPVFLHLVDLGGGLRPEAVSKRTVIPEDIVSIPFRGLWQGLIDERFGRRSAPPLRSFGATFDTTLANRGPRQLGSPNYACITDTYLNLNSRQAYHFAIVDAFLSDNQNNNHVALRMKGGGGAPWQRSLRAEFAAEIMRLHHFVVDVRGDLLNGWARGIDLATGIDKLKMLGRLLSFSALLDLWMTGEEQMKQYVQEFMETEAQMVEKGP